MLKTPAEVAEMLSVHEKTVRQRCQEGRIRHAAKAGGKWMINPYAEWPELFVEDAGEAQRREPPAEAAPAEAEPSWTSIPLGVDCDGEQLVLDVRVRKIGGGDAHACQGASPLLVRIIAEHLLGAGPSRPDGGGRMEYVARDYLSVPEAARELHTKPETLRKYARRAYDPFPIRLLPWCRRNGIVQRREMDEWFARNASQYGGE